MSVSKLILNAFWALQVATKSSTAYLIDVMPIIYLVLICFTAVACEESSSPVSSADVGGSPADQGAVAMDVLDADAGRDAAPPIDIRLRDSGSPLDQRVDTQTLDVAPLVDLGEDLGGAAEDARPTAVDALIDQGGALPDVDLEPEPARCGDGRVDPFEACDDGNLINLDGCDATCSHEYTEIAKSSVTVAETAAAGSLDDFHFVADGPGSVAFRVAIAGVCEVGANLDFALLAVGRDEPIALAPLGGGEADGCGWYVAHIDGGEHIVRISPSNPNEGVTYTFELKHERPLALSTEYEGAMAVGGDDRFVLELDAPQRVDLRTTGLEGWCAARTWMTLYTEVDGDLVQVEFDGGGGNAGCARLRRFLPEGRHIIVIRETNRRAIEAYRLVVTVEGRCGDSVINIEEECDDGNVNDGDGCSSDCLRQSICGNGEVEIGETCDDGNQRPDDGCDEVCQQEITCGNGRLDADEECDDGNQLNFDGCDQFCSLEEFWINAGQVRLISRLAVGADDIFNFTADGPARLDVSVRDDEFGCRPSADSHMALFEHEPGAQPVLLAENDDDPANPPCSRLNIDVGAGEHFLVISEANDLLSIDRYMLVFRLVRDITNLQMVAGGFPADGTDRYTFDINVPRRLRVGFADADGGCRQALQLEVLMANDVRPLDFDRIVVGGCAGVQGILEPGQYDLRASTRDGSAVPAYRLWMEWRAP